MLKGDVEKLQLKKYTYQLLLILLFGTNTSARIILIAWSIRKVLYFVKQILVCFQFVSFHLHDSTYLAYIKGHNYFSEIVWYAYILDFSMLFMISLTYFWFKEAFSCFTFEYLSSVVAWLSAKWLTCSCNWCTWKKIWERSWKFYIFISYAFYTLRGLENLLSFLR